MEEILELDERPAENDHPLVCFDEKSVELHAAVRAPIAMQPNHPNDATMHTNAVARATCFCSWHPKPGSVTR